MRPDTDPQAPDLSPRMWLLVASAIGLFLLLLAVFPDSI